MKKILKNISILLLCSMIAVLVSACTNGNKYSLSVDESIKSGIELVIGEEPKNFIVSIKNYDEKFSTNLNYSFYDNIAQIEKSEHIGDGKIQVTILGLVGGSTTLKITSYQGGLNLEIPVIVTEKIETITLKNNITPYIVKGEDLVFNGEELFEFNPRHTKQKEVDYYFIESAINKVKIDDGIISSSNTSSIYFNSNGEERVYNVTSNYVNIMAVSVYDSLISCSFRVDIINKIQNETINLTQNLTDNEIIIIENGEYKNNIQKFIRNNKKYSKYNFTLKVDATNCSINIYSKLNKFLPEINKIIEENGITTIDFSIIPLATGVDEIVVKLSDKTVSAYSKELSCEVESIEIPSGLLLNDIPTGLEIVLFSGQTIDNSTRVNYSIYPSASYENNPAIYLQFYEDLAKTKFVEIEDILGVSYNNQEIDTFVNLVISEDKKIAVEVVNNEFVINEQTYNLDNLEIIDSEFLIGTQKFSVVPSLKITNLKQDGKVNFWSKSQEKEDLFINFMCLTNEVGFEAFIIENMLKASVKKSATAFYIDESYEDGTIYNEINVANVFSGLRIEPSDAYVGEMLFTPIDNATEIAEIGQIENNNVLTLDLLIKGKKEGVAKYIISLPNGYQTTITINVVKLYNSNMDLSFKLKEANPNVASISTDENGNLTEIIVRKSQDRIYFTTEINASEGTYNFVENVNETINRHFILADTTFENNTGVIQFWTKYIEDFKLKDNQEMIEHIFKVKCFESLKSLVLQTENDTVYEQSSLGYFEVQQEYHKGKLSIKDLDKDKFEEIKDNLTWTFTKSYLTNNIDTSKNGNIITITDYGTFDTDTLTFTYSTTSSNISNEIYIYVEYIEYDKTYSSFIVLKLRTFVKANEITLKNYIPKINLDIINSSETLYLNIGPDNATDKRFIYEYEKISGDYSVSFEVADDYSYIKASYNGGSGSKGILRLIPISQYISEEEYVYSIEIEIEVADGTREFPILLKNASDFINAFSSSIGLTKHYQIKEEIDFSGVNVPMFGELKGSIVGTTERAKLSGIKITNSREGYAGIFSKISKLEIAGTEVPSIENLKLEGSFNFNNAENVNIGFICGINEGTLKNVSLTLLESRINITAEKNIYIGGLCAENKGNITLVVDNNTNETTLVNIPEGQSLTIYETANNYVYVGGAVGNNSGSITFARNDGKTLVSNKFGYSAWVNIKSNTNVAGLVGFNSGLVQGHLVGGKITYFEEYSTLSYKAGLIVTNDGDKNTCIVENNISRVFIRSNSYLSGLIARALRGTVKNNIVQATFISNVNELEIPLLVFKKQTATAQNEQLAGLFAETSSNSVNENNTLISFHNGYDVMFLDANGKYKNESNVLYTNAEFASLDNKFTKNIIDGKLELEKTEEYLSYYKAVEKEKQRLLEVYNIYDLPFVVNSTSVYLKNNLIIESKNPNVVSVLENGDLKINNIGYAEILIKSSLNYENLVIAKLYVSYKLDGYKLYYSSEKTEDTQLPTNSEILLYQGQTFSLYSTVYANAINVNNSKIELVAPSTGNISVNLKTDDIDSYVNITSNNGHHVFSCSSVEGKNKIYGEVVYTNEKYTKVIYSDKVEDSFNYNFYTQYKKGASKINLGQNNVSVYPSQEIVINVNVVSDDENEDLKVEVYDYNGYNVTSYFEITSIKENLDYQFNVQLLDYNNFGEYTFKFVAKNGYSQLLNVNILSQPITNIAVNTYSKYEIDDKTQDLEITEFVEPGSTTNHLTIFVDPYYADYDYIEITNANTNYQTNSQVLFSYVGNDTKIEVDYSYTNNGIRIYKSAIGFCNLHILKYVLGSNAQDSSNTYLDIKAYKDNQPVYETSKKLQVQALADVTVSLSGRGPDAMNYVAKGTNQLIDINFGKYSIDEVVIEARDNPSVIVHKEANRIEIKNSAKSGTSVNIDSYGTYKVNGKTLKGRVLTLTLKIVDFIFQNDTVSSAYSKVSTTLSSSMELSKEVIDGLNLVYNSSLTGVNNSVENFKENLHTLQTLEVGVYNDTTKTYDYILLDKTKDYTFDEFSLEYDGVWKLIPLKVVTTGKYKIKSTFILKYDNMISVVASGGKQYSIEKDIEITSNSSKESPLPIRNIEQLYSMEDGKYYILLEDLDFTKSQIKLTPIKAKVAGFNGNNHKIIFSSMEVSELVDGDVQTISSVQNVGLFETIEKDTLIQNVNIHISVVGTINISKYTNTTTYVGLLAGENKGVITNCYVTSNSGAEISANVVEIGVSNTSTYIAGLVGKNEGYITNSRFECNIVSNSHIAGFVGINNKHISSSFVNNSQIVNSSTGVNTTNKTSGFVIENNGNIYESYVSGGYKAITDLYSTLKTITGKQEVASFVYRNNELVKNCYADISTYGQGKTAGFVFSNLGTVENCFTTCKLKDNSQSSYAFIENGNTPQNSYYASDINTSIYDYKDRYSNEELKGLTLLSNNQFGEDEFAIKDFVVANSTSKDKRDYIWFFASKETVFEDGFNKQGNLRFNTNKPQLSSANIISTSSYEFLSLEYDPITNEEVYNYIDKNNVYGGKYNPIIIDSAESLEKEFAATSKQQNNQDVNNKYFRIVKDIDYALEDIVSSSLFNTVFIGELHGNNLSINNYSINSNKNLISAGLFAQLGNKTEKGSIKTLNAYPKYINLPNASVVGALVGTVNYGNIIEVSVSNKDLTVSAKNIAGGVVGRAINSFNLINVYSNVSAHATTFTKDFSSKMLYNLLTDKYAEMSYAGSIAGIVAGEFGYVRNANVTDRVVTIAKIAGVMFGGITDNAVVEDIDLTINSNFLVKAYAYCGILAGHLEGKVKNINMTQTERTVDLFSVDPITPVAIGGIAGIMQNIFEETTISSVNTNVDIISTKCYSVGGIVGHVVTDENMVSGLIENISINATVQGAACVGGLIGRISSFDAHSDDCGYNKVKEMKDRDNLLTIKNISINVSVVCDNSQTYANYLTKYIYVGGIIGQNYSYMTFADSDVIDLLGVINPESENSIKLDYNLKAISESAYVYYGYGCGLSTKEGNFNVICDNNILTTPKVKRIGEYAEEDYKLSKYTLN